MKELLKQVLRKVDVSRGAPMGRFSNEPKERPRDKKIFDYAVLLEDGYDEGGAYWGYPNDLRVEFSEDLNYIRFYRTT